ncbi:MAG: ATP-binding protein [Oscillospiraceae bacterium]|jgi:hypothetical protein|nr:ATP-binding protein [Oscillospiraceae bacterium]
MRELSLNVLDIVQNSITALSLLTTVAVYENTAEQKLRIEVTDTGKGMTEEQVQNVVDPFFTTRTTRSVGLGVPLFKMAAEQTGGSFEISSVLGSGTHLAADFVTSSIDMPPLGDINSTISVLIRMNPHIDFIYTYETGGQSFTLDTRELRTMLSDVPLDNPDVMAWIDEFLTENTNELKNSK